MPSKSRKAARKPSFQVSCCKEASNETITIYILPAIGRTIDRCIDKAVWNNRKMKNITIPSKTEGTSSNTRGRLYGLVHSKKTANAKNELKKPNNVCNVCLERCFIYK